MEGRPRSSDMVVTTPAGLLSARYTRSWRLGIRVPSTLMIWRSGSTLAPYRRTISPSTSTRPSPISSSHCRRLPTPAAASTFWRRTPPGTSVSESRPGSSVRSMPGAVFPPPALSALPRPPGRPPGCRRPPRRSRSSWARALIARIVSVLGILGTLRVPSTARVRSTARILSAARVQSIARVKSTAKVRSTARAWSTRDVRGVFLGAVGILDLIGQEGREVGQVVQAGQAKPFQEVPGRAVEDGAGFVFGARLLDQAAQRQGAHHPVTVDPPYGGDACPADRLPVGDHGQRLQRGLGQPDLLPVAYEALHHRRTLLAGVETPASRHLTQVEPPALRGV